jgi:lysozyme family protein
LRLAVFDAAVNSGVSRAIMWLQEAVGATPDGVFGPRTLLAVAQAPAVRTAREVCYIRLGFLVRLKTFPVFGAGWTRRVLSILRGI